MPSAVITLAHIFTPNCRFFSNRELLSTHTPNATVSSGNRILLPARLEGKGLGRRSLLKAGSPPGKKSSRKKAVFERDPVSTANTSTLLPSVLPSKRLAELRKMALTAVTPIIFPNFSGASTGRDGPFTTISPPTLYRAWSLWLWDRLDWKVAPNTPNAAASIRITASEPWGMGSRAKRRRDNWNHAAPARVPAQASNRTTKGSARNRRTAAAKSPKTGPRIRVGSTFRPWDDSSSATNPPRPRT